MRRFALSLFAALWPTLAAAAAPANDAPVSREVIECLKTAPAHLGKRACTEQAMKDAVTARERKTNVPALPAAPAPMPIGATPAPHAARPAAPAPTSPATPPPTSPPTPPPTPAVLPLTAPTAAAINVVPITAAVPVPPLTSPAAMSDSASKLPPREQRRPPSLHAPTLPAAAPALENAVLPAKATALALPASAEPATPPLAKVLPPVVPATPTGAAKPTLPAAAAPLAATAVANNPAVPGKAPPAPFESGQLVIYWKDAGDAALGVVVMAREFKLNPASENRLPNLGGVIATFKLTSQREAERVKNILTSRYPTWRIDFHARYLPHQSLRPPPPVPAGVPSLPRQYWSQKIDTATPTAETGRGIRIGIVDTAVDVNAALKNNLLSQRSFLGIGEIAASSAHGSALATLIAGRDDGNAFSGVSPGAALYVAAIMHIQGAETASNTATLVRALDWLLGERVQVVNLSLGGAGDRIMEEVIARLLRSRVIVVAAAGNGGDDAVPSYPAAYPGVIAVTASDAEDQVFTRANRGPYITLTAPGVDVWTPDRGSGRYVSGTSFAAAIVSGAVATMLAKRPALDAAGSRDLLCRHARDLGSPGTDPIFGCGLIQLRATLAAIP